MTNVSFDQNHSSGKQNAPTLPGGRCEQHTAASQRLAPAPCRTRLLETLRWISPVRSGHRLERAASSRPGASLGLCRQRAGVSRVSAASPHCTSPRHPSGRAVDGCKQKIGVSGASIHKGIQIIPESKAGIISACKSSPRSRCGRGRRIAQPMTRRISYPRLSRPLASKA